jgi:putative redox protein
MVSATIGKEHYRTELFIAGHTVIADEPEDLGGTNLGPSPGQFLMLSLASCTAITLRMYADRKNWDVTKIMVEVSSEKVESKTLFKREISFEGAIDDEQRKRLLQIANSCPVHKTLTNPIEVQTKLVVA